MSLTSVAASTFGSSAGNERTKSCAGPPRSTSRPTLASRLGVRLGCIGVGDRDVDGDRHQQRLRRQPLARSAIFRRSYERALVRGVHVDEHEAALRLGEDINAVQLCDRVSQRMLACRHRVRVEGSASVATADGECMRHRACVEACSPVAHMRAVGHAEPCAARASRRRAITDRSSSAR